MPHRVTRRRRLAMLGTVAFLVGLAPRTSAQTTLSFAKLPALAFPDHESGTLRTGGHGAFWADANGDGRPDLYITRNERSSEPSTPEAPAPSNTPEAQGFFLNAPPSFEESGTVRGIRNGRFGVHGAVWADLDNDGDYDLVVGNTYTADAQLDLCRPTATRYECPNDYAPLSIYENTGGGYFTDVTPANVLAQRSATRAVLAFDMESDGDLDLVAFNGPIGADAPFDGFNDLNPVFRNEGNFRFTLLHDSPLRLAPLAQGGIAVDFDNDGDVDVLASGGTNGPLKIFRNGGAGQFTVLDGPAVGVVDPAHGGLTAGDVDNDGDLDMLIDYTSAPWAEKAALYLNTGTGQFTLVQRFDRVNGFMGGFGDLDNDGDLDLVFAGDSRVWVNDGAGRFTAALILPVPDVVRVDDPDPRSIGFADYDLDGDLDFAVASKVRESYVIRNDTVGRGHFIKLKLTGTRAGAGAFGAKVRVYRPGHIGGRLVAYREAQGPYGYLAQDDPVLHIGIGGLTAVDVEVEFPGGRRRVLFNQPADDVITVDGRFQDTNNNRIDDNWERFYFGALVDGPADPDGDGVSNAAEFQAGTHPNARAAHHRYLAEGAVGFFDTLVAIANPGTATARVLLTFETDDGQVLPWPVVVPARSMSRVSTRNVTGLASFPGRAFSTLVESDQQVIVDRRMEWGAGVYSLTAERSLASPAQTWHFAEGFTSPFNLFFLIQNPHPTQTAAVTVTYLRAGGQAPGHKTYSVAPQSRLSIWVNEEVTDEGTSLAQVEVGARFDSNIPIVVERAMYLDLPGQPLGAGHESAGVTSLAQSWFLAEGHVGRFFDNYVLIGNPSPGPASLTVTYLLPNGQTVPVPHTVPASGKLTIWMDQELAAVRGITESDVSVRVSANVPVAVERAMWWSGEDGGTTWYEAHSSPGYPGVTGATSWGIADGENSEDGRAVQTYLLVANVSSAPTDVTVTLFFEEGGTAQRTFSGVPANSRFTIPVWRDIPESVGHRFGARLTSSQPNAIVVERAIYSDAGGVALAAGGNALATPLP